MKRLLFLGDSLKRIQSFPPLAQHKMGFELKKVQQSLTPDDFKPMTSIGVGVERFEYGWNQERIG
jgi:phage-related protein